VGRVHKKNDHDNEIMIQRRNFFTRLGKRGNISPPLEENESERDRRVLSKNYFIRMGKNQNYPNQTKTRNNSFLTRMRKENKNYIMRVGKRSGDDFSREERQQDKAYFLRMGKNDDKKYFMRLGKRDEQILW